MFQQCHLSTRKVAVVTMFDGALFGELQFCTRSFGLASPVCNLLRQIGAVLAQWSMLKLKIVWAVFRIPKWTVQPLPATRRSYQTVWCGVVWWCLMWWWGARRAGGGTCLHTLACISAHAPSHILVTSFIPATTTQHITTTTLNTATTSSATPSPHTRTHVQTRTYSNTERPRVKRTRGKMTGTSTGTGHRPQSTSYEERGVVCGTREAQPPAFFFLFQTRHP